MVWNDAKEIDYSLKADSVRRECEKSLSRLDTEVIDLYQIHWPADDLPETEEGWATRRIAEGRQGALDRRIKF